MSVNKDQMDVIITVLILLEAIIVLAWMDMNWNQTTTLVQVCNYIHYYVRKLLLFCLQATYYVFLLSNLTLSTTYLCVLSICYAFYA